MTDEQIIKALECCCLGGMSCPNGCPLYDYEGNCWYQLKRPLLDIINRQKAEIEEWKKILESRHRVIDSLEDSIIGLPDQIRAEAVKEFLKKQEIELANNTDISAVGYQSVIELNIKILKEMGIE